MNVCTYLLSENLYSKWCYTTSQKRSAWTVLKLESENVTENLKANQPLIDITHPSPLPPVSCSISFYWGEKQSFMQTLIQKIANNRLKRTRSTGLMPTTSGSIPSRTTATKPSTDQDKKSGTSFSILLPKGTLSLKKSLKIYLTKIKSMKRRFWYCFQKEP